METTEDGLVTLQFTPDEARKLKSFLSRKASGIQKPRIVRQGNRIIIDTGLDEVCTLNKSTPGKEIHALRVYQRAGKKIVNELGEVTDEIPAVTVVERIEGGFCYMDGSPVNVRADLDIVPKEWRQDALDWFEKQYGKEAPGEREASAPSVPSNGTKPTEEIELTLKDKVIILSARGLSGQEIAQKLGCSEGSVSIHKKNAVKEKILSKDGKKFTPMGQEKFGRFELNF